MALVLCSAFARADELETQRIALSGLGKDDGVAWEFFCTAGQNSGVWTNILVPSCWETKGFGAYGYQQDPLKEQGKYRRGFEVPAAWKGKTIRLTFEGSMTDTEVWINGQSAGPKHQGAFYPFTYDVTSLVNIGGTNLLEVTVSKFSANEGVNAAERRGDYWNFGGIFRPVHLDAVPAEFIERVAIDARADGSFRMDVFPAGHRAADRVVAQIEGLGEPFSVAIPAGGDHVTLSAKLSGQKNWTAESPSLYTVQVTLETGGKPVHRISQRFGFRTFEVRPGDGLYLNGSRITLKGSCRHSFWPESGRTTSPELSLQDVRLMKEMNMNAVRMSHYPPDVHFLDTCDELGLYVLDELGGWQHAYDTPVGKTLVETMVKRDVNHPAILFWDNGNEGGFNFDLDGEYGKWDPQGRRVLHPWALHDGVLTSHYRPYDEVKEKVNSGTLYMPTEFLHALYDGGGGAGLDDYWPLLGHGKMGVGGFIWAFVDEGVVRTDLGGKIDNNVNRAPDGLLGPYREKEGSFFTVREIWSPVQIATTALPADFDGSLPVENLYDFTDLAACRFTWRVVSFPGPSETSTADKIIAEGELPGPGVKPRSRGTLRLPLPAGWRDADALKLSAMDPAGRLLWTWSWPTRTAAMASQKLVQPGSTKIQAERTSEGIRVQAGDLRVLVGAADGMLASVERAGKQMPGGVGPRVVLGGTKTVMDGKKKRLQPVVLGRSNVLSRLEYKSAGTGVSVTAEYSSGDLRNVVWTILPEGWIRMDYELAASVTCDVAGLAFDVPETAVKSVRWQGRGPYRVWKNRMKGTELGVWTNAFNDTDPGKTYSYPEFKGFFGSWNWAVFTLEDARLTLVNGTDRSYLGVFRPRDGESPMSTELHLPPLGLGVYHAIPPIGNKFSPASVLGPQSQPNVLTGVQSGSFLVRFDPAPR